MSSYIFTPEEAEKLNVETANETDQSLAFLFHKQVEAFYSLPDKQWERKEVYFSPSGVSKCLRELYYQNTNAPQDNEPVTPWKKRVPRNGTGIHEATQADYLTMEERLREAGLPVHFRFLEAEIKGERSYRVGDYIVKLKGRADGKLGLLDEKGNVIKVIGYEKKTKDKRKNLNKIIKEGQPQLEHRLQATAYALIWGVKEWLFEYESLQKPEWKEDEPEKPDQVHFLFVADKAEARALLIRLAKVVEAIEKKVLPEPELDKCGFCPFKTQCNKDGGYQ